MALELGDMTQNNDHPVWNASRPFLMFLRAYVLNILLALVMLGVGAWMAFLIATSDGKSPHEAAYQAMVLTIASVIASLIVTKIYAEQGHGQNLRDHGVQIAGGIIVLKRQIEVLSDWIVSKRLAMRTSPHIPEVTDAVLEHIEQTLSGFRGMTDAALGGIAGVIGDALAQYESVMEQISRIRLDALHQTREIEEKIQFAGSSAEIAALQSEIQEIALRTERDITQLARKSAIPIPEQPKRLSDEIPVGKMSGTCPMCSTENSFQMPDRVGETKVVVCAHCGSAFNAHLALGGKVIARPLGQARRSDTVVSTFQAKVLSYLRQTQAYVEPKQLTSVLKRIVQADASLHSQSGQRSAKALQDIVFGYMDAGELLDVGRGAVRIVFKMLYQSRAFKFNAGVPISFSAPFVNALDERQLYEAYVRGCLHRVSGIVDLGSARADELAQVLILQDITDRKRIVESAMMSFSPKGSPPPVGVSPPEEWERHP